MTEHVVPALPENEIFELVERLDVRGPRYTSYPTAPVWKNHFPKDDYLQGLNALVQRGKPIAIYLHLPFCKSRCLYCGCNSFITGKEETICNYVDHLIAEIRNVGKYVERKLTHSWLHLGGGTPTHTPPAKLAELLDVLLEEVPGIARAERSVEVDPRVTTDEHLRILSERGFRRISIGLQDFDETVQKSINRVFSVEKMQAFVERCRSFGFASVNIDMIYGLPYQTADSWKRTLEQVSTFRPERLASFGYAHLPDKIKHQRALPAEKMPTSRERLGMLLDTNRHFASMDYQIIGMDHFAAPHDALAEAVREGHLWRNFMGYTEIRGVEMLGFGASSIGEMNEMFVQNTTLPKVYNQRIDDDGWAIARGHKLDADDRVRKTMINDLMCNLIVRVPNEADEVDGLREKLANITASLAPFEEPGLIEPYEDGWKVTALGRLFLRNLAMPFDRYLPDQANVTFSRTI
ncbi:MAG TPA: oxygen-independent coproporphyrinogen III oxidase [Bacteroidetes bacterium]|nr:oxygen-independent coproporphyrinogen-III oxidase [bacterium BMS3Bbin04]HDO64571.1 oxygen-independent coproporphyrinogen III oxidase [Bacteroidota bacterium]HEX03696.1 oxygen-independent coproporphyrinogen III oxidase [Bacteroidota bacterium]